MAKCLFCGKELTGIQKKFCSRKHKGYYNSRLKTRKKNEERLKAIKNDWEKIDNDYYVTPEGEVWSRVKNGFLKSDLLKDGYEQVTLHGHHEKVHRLVANAFVANPNNLPQVNHIDGNKQNNHFSNLEWTDARGNYYHAREHGLCNHGTFLSKQDRELIREMYKSGKYTYKELEEMFNISVTTLWRVLDGLDHPKKLRKITPDEGRKIADKFHEGNLSKCAVAEMFNVSDTTVGRWHKKIYGSLNVQ